MKLRILIAPTLLALGIILIVWAVLPKYYDDKLKREEAKTEEGRLKEAQKKAEMVSKLMADLGTKADKQEILFSFLPEKQEEEEIINDLNNIASMEAVSIKSLTTVKIPAKAPAADTSATPATEKNVSQSNFFNVDFTVTGEYGKIKNVVDRLSKLRRFNKIFSLTISKIAENQTADVVTGSNLQAKIIMSFYYLKKADAISISSAIFNQESFDMAPVDKINNLRTINVLKVEGVSAGRENPFIQ